MRLFSGYRPPSETEYKVKGCGNKFFIPVWSASNVQICHSASSVRKIHSLSRHLLSDRARVEGSYLPQSWILANSLVPGIDSLTSGSNKVH